MMTLACLRCRAPTTCLIYVKKKLLCLVLNYSYAAFLMQLLIVSGDVELNPGPTETIETDKLESILAAVQRIEAGQSAMLASITSLQNDQKTTDALVNELLERVTAVERNIAAVPLQAPQNPPIDNDNTLNSEDLEIRTRCDDAENRLRRSNLLFLGIPDSHY
ncbi:unnamed protein product [Ixodes persulcatus]